MSIVPCEVSDEEIARRAYELWHARGCPEGDGSQDWETAKQELLAEKERSDGRSWWARLRSSINGRDM